MSQPRAARKGGKVAVPSAAPKSSPPLEPAPAGGDTSPMPALPPTKSEPREPSLAKDESVTKSPHTMADFLFERSQLPESQEEEKVAVGVVRGKGQSATVTAVDPVKTTEAVEADLLPKIKALPDNGVSPFLDWVANAPTHSTAVCDVLLVPAAHGLPTAQKFGKSLGACVACVSPLRGDLNRYAAMVSEEAKEKVGQGCGVWTGSQRTGTDATRIWMMNEDTLLANLFIHGVHQPFSHIILLKSHLQSAKYEAIYALLRIILVQQSKEMRTKLVISGHGIDSEEYVKYFAELSVMCPRNEADDPMFPVKTFYADDVAALTKLPLKAVASKHFDATTIQPPVLDSIVQQTVGLVKWIQQHAVKPPVIAVYASEPVEVVGALRDGGIGNLPVRYLSESGSYDGPQTKDGVVVVGSQPLSDAECCRMGLTYVIDMATEKVPVIGTDKTDLSVPSKRLQWETMQTAALRSRGLGWSRPGFYFALVREEDREKLQKKTPPKIRSMRLEAVALALSRGPIPPAQLFKLFPNAPSDETAVWGLQYLGELGLINPVVPRLGVEIESGELIAPDTSLPPAYPTFVGAWVQRVPLPVDAALLVVQGAVLGLDEITTVAACVLAYPPLQHVPKGQRDSATAMMRKFEVGLCSDVLASVYLYLLYFDEVADKAESERRAWCDAHHCDESRLNQIKNVSVTVQQEIAQYVFPHVMDSTRRLQFFKRHAKTLGYLIATCCARNACVVRRQEDAIRARPAAGQMVFIRSTKEVVPNQYSPTIVPWIEGDVIIPTLVNNSMKLTTSNHSILPMSQFYLLQLLFQTHIQYSERQYLPGMGDSVLFLFTLNKQTKRVRTDAETAAAVLDFRAVYARALGAVYHRRCLLSAIGTPTGLEKILESADSNFVLSDVREKLTSELHRIVQLECKEVQVTFTEFGSHTITPEAILPSTPDAPPYGADIMLIKERQSRTAVELVQMHSTPTDTAFSPMALPPQHSSVLMVEDDEVEMEGEESVFARRGPIYEDEESE